MYQFSRAIYRTLAPLIGRQQADRDGAHEQVLRACEGAIERLATDPHYFARPARTLFTDIRAHFPIGAQHRVWRVVSRYMSYAEHYMHMHPFAGVELTGKPMQCRATTRRGTQCQRVPLPRNGYCPSHQHLAETEDSELLAARVGREPLAA